MANIPIWPGSSSFVATTNPTPFGFYDADTDFISDADKVSTWCASRLGYPLIDIELQEINFYACFEEAVNEYGAQVYNYQIRDNMSKLRGFPTASTNGSWASLNQINVKDEFLSQISNLGGDSGGGGGGSYKDNTRTYSASLNVQSGQQKYDLINSGLVNWETGSIQIESGSLTVKIKKIYHYAPTAINRYFDPYAGTGTGIQSLMQSFGFGNYSPGVNFMLMPLYFDALKIQAIELNDQIRKSAYHYEIEQDQYLKLFPIPNGGYKLWFDYGISQGTDSEAVDLNPTTGQAYGQGGVTDISNAPYSNPTYKFINHPGKQWIRKYTLALAKEMLGGIRGKYQSVPIPGAETTLDYSRLLQEASAEKTSLIEQLREDLSELTTAKVIEREFNEEQGKIDIDKTGGRYQIYIH